MLTYDLTKPIVIADLSEMEFGSLMEAIIRLSKFNGWSDAIDKETGIQDLEEEIEEVRSDYENEHEEVQTLENRLRYIIDHPILTEDFIRKRIREQEHYLSTMELRQLPDAMADYLERKESAEHRKEYFKRLLREIY